MKDELWKRYVDAKRALRILTARHGSLMAALAALNVEFEAANDEMANSVAALKEGAEAEIDAAGGTPKPIDISLHGEP